MPLPSYTRESARSSIAFDGRADAPGSLTGAKTTTSSDSARYCTVMKIPSVSSTHPARSSGVSSSPVIREKSAISDSNDVIYAPFLTRHRTNGELPFTVNELGCARSFVSNISHTPIGSMRDIVAYFEPFRFPSKIPDKFSDRNIKS